MNIVCVDFTSSKSGTDVDALTCQAVAQAPEAGAASLCSHPLELRCDGMARARAVGHHRGQLDTKSRCRPEWAAGATLRTRRHTAIGVEDRRPAQVHFATIPRRRARDWEETRFCLPQASSPLVCPTSQTYAT